MVDLKEEKQYEQLRRMAQELHIPIPEAFIEFEVTDRNGKVIQRLKLRSHSWVRNFYNHFFTHLAGVDANDDTFGAGKLNIKPTDGVVEYNPSAVGWEAEDTAEGTTYGGYRAAAGINTRGIIVGSGINAESFEDYVLQTLIANGTGGGELAYIESEPNAKNYDTPTKVFSNTLVRYFNNNSGGDVLVNEVALACYGGSPTHTHWNVYWIQSRDKLASTVTVPDTGQLKVTYTIQLTYPA